MSAHTGQRTGKRNPPNLTPGAVALLHSLPASMLAILQGTANGYADGIYGFVINCYRAALQKRIEFEPSDIVILIRNHSTCQWHLLASLERDVTEGWEKCIELVREEQQEKQRAREFAETLLDPWADPPPPAWPPGILARHLENTIAEIALADGVDMGAQAMAFLAAVSGAADKQSRLEVYLNGRFKVPPILWIAVVAESGMRKSAMLQTAFAPLKRANARRFADYREALQRYERQTPEEKLDNVKPTEPSSLIVDDFTPEILAALLTNDPRGLLALKEELVSLFEFGRYSSTSGAGARSFLLSTFDGGDTWVHRKSSGASHIRNAALTVFGCTQPSRLAKFKDLEDDGLLQRFLITLPAAVHGGSRPDVTVRGLQRLETTIVGLVHRDAMQYQLTREGAAMVRETERRSGELERLSDDGLGFPAWVRKMHGQHARLAFTMHLMEAPSDPVIADDVVERAGRLIAEYLLPCAISFYGKLPDSRLALMRSVGGWLLTKAHDRFRAADIQAGVAGCAKKGLRDIQAALDPFVAGGWIEPETEFPTNRAWTLVAGVREAFAERTRAERERRAQLYALVRGSAASDRSDGNR